MADIGCRIADCGLRIWDGGMRMEGGGWRLWVVRFLMVDGGMKENIKSDFRFFTSIILIMTYSTKL